MYLKDPKTGEKSVTLTMMVAAFSICLIKLTISGMTYGDFSAGTFSAAEFAIALAATGSIYGFRKHTDKKSK